MLPWTDKVVHYLVEVDMPSKSFEGTEEEYRYMRMLQETKYVGNFPQIIQVRGILRNARIFRSYIDKPASLGRQFDLIIGDINLI